MQSCPSGATRPLAGDDDGPLAEALDLNTRPRNGGQDATAERIRPTRPHCLSRGIVRTAGAMSVTTLLIPVDEPEAEAVLAGGPGGADTIEAIARRARHWQACIACVDTVREDLHALLFHRWADSRGPREGLFARLLRPFRATPTARPSTGYDPYVQLFGRPLPVTVEPPREVAQVLRRLQTLELGPSLALLAEQLDKLDLRAGALLRQTTPTDDGGRLTAGLEREQHRIVTTLAATGDLQPALVAIARMMAWSRPIWRLDGESLSGLLGTVGLPMGETTAQALFDELAVDRPEIDSRRAQLPTQLSDHAGTGAYLSSADVKGLAGALRLQRLTLARNAARGHDHPQLIMRHLRLLEEAICFAEASDSGLIEAAGIEWRRGDAGAGGWS